MKRPFARLIERLPNRVSLAFTLVALVSLVMVSSILSAGLLAYALNRFGLIDLNRPDPYRGIYVLLYISLFMGVVIATLLSRRSVKPVRDMMKATGEVARGDFSAEVKGSFVLELDSLAASFNAMVRELRGIETLRGDFVRDFSHEFKTPIVSIRGFAKLLKEGGLSEEEKQEYLDIIIRESERLVGLSASILELSKVENMEILRDKTAYRLDEQIRLAVLMLEPKWSAKRIRMDIALDDPITIVGDRNLLQQVWINLLDNAIKYTDSGGRISVGLRRSGREAAAFRLADDGCGMSEETLRRMFEKFYQGDASRSVAGNGLGLAIVRRIVELCGGTIEAQSELGEGTAFTVRLPLGTEASASAAAGNRQPVSTP